MKSPAASALGSTGTEVHNRTTSPPTGRPRMAQPAFERLPQSLPELDAQVQALLHHADPSEALIDAIRQAFAAADPHTPAGLRARLGLHLLDMLSLTWDYAAIPPLLTELEPLLLQEPDPELRAEFLARQAGLSSLLNCTTAAATALERLRQLVGADSNKLQRAYLGMAMARHHFGQSQFEEALGCARDALQWFAEAGRHRFDRNLWVLMGQCHHKLAQHAQRLACFETGLQSALEVKDWRSAANLLTGVAEAQLDLGDYSAAMAGCEQATALLPEDAVRVGAIRAELLAIQGLALGRRGQLAQGIEKLSASAAAHGAAGTRWNQVRRLKELADLLLQDGQSKLAFERLREAHELELRETRERHRREAVSALEQAAHARALEEQAMAREHAAELNKGNQALKAALALQQRLQDELVETRRLLTLSHLLAGIAHELGTPLGNSLTALDTITGRLEDIAAAVEQSRLGRARLQENLTSIGAALDLGRRNLDRALVLLQTYRNLDASSASAQGRMTFAQLLESVWSKRGAQRIALTIEAGSALELEAAPVLQEILDQLLENVLRHAYPLGEGRVRASFSVQSGQAQLTWRDGGIGIPADRLPHVFDPFFSSTFGQGRSGLGLFQAQVLAMKILGGRLKAASSPGQGCEFELSWPVSRDALKADDAAAESPTPSTPPDAAAPG